MPDSNDALANLVEMPMALAQSIEIIVQACRFGKPDKVSIGSIEILLTIALRSKCNSEARSKILTAIILVEKYLPKHKKVIELCSKVKEAYQQISEEEHRNVVNFAYQNISDII